MVEVLRKAVPPEIEKTVDSVPPHACRHGVLGSQSSQGRARRGVLGRQKKVVMLVQQCSMQGDQCLPLVVTGFVCGVGLHLVVGDFDAFPFQHHEAGVDALNLGHELFLRNGTCFRLLDGVGRLIVGRTPAPFRVHNR